MYLFASGLGFLKRSSKQTSKQSEVKVNYMTSHVYFDVLLELLKRNGLIKCRKSMHFVILVMQNETCNAKVLASQTT